jgi:predicted kinase
MARLILLNGPPACGKSTLAALYTEDHPLALGLDIDRLRAMIGGWRADPAGAGPLARAMALAAARAHLTAGHDVVVPQMLGRPEFRAQLEQLARDVGADFREVFLFPDERGAVRQYRERARSVAGAARPDLAVSTELTEADLTRTYRWLVAVAAARPSAVVLRTQTGQVAAAYQALLGCLGEGRGG